MARIAMALALGAMLAGTAGAMADSPGYIDAKSAYDTGQYDAAVQKLHPLAEEGDTQAQFLLGQMHENGQGVAVDYAKAADYYRKAAELGYAPAEDRLGRLYREGWGVRRNYGQAVRWLEASARAGDPEGETDLGGMYAAGLGVPESYAEAIKWYRLAAGTGDGRAENDLGVMYEYGEGVGQDLRRAYMWCDLAAAALTGPDRRSAVNNRDQLGKMMNLADAEKAQAMALQCQASDLKKCD